MSDSDSPDDVLTVTRHGRKLARMKTATALIVSCTAFVAACSAFFKPRDDRATEQGYEAITATLKDLGEENQRQHDDLVSLRAYLDGYLRGSHAEQDAGAEAGEVLSVPVVVVSPSRPATSASTHVIVVHPAPPPMGERPKPASPPSFRAVQEKANKL